MMIDQLSNTDLSTMARRPMPPPGSSFPMTSMSKESVLRRELTLRGIGSLPDDRATAEADEVLREMVQRWNMTRSFKSTIERRGGKRFIRLTWVEPRSRGSTMSCDASFDMEDMTEENATMSEVMES